MQALGPEAFADAMPACEPTAGLRLRLEQVAAGLDSGFNAASASLAEAIDGIDAIVAALQAVAGAVGQGAASTAVADLTRAAQGLGQVPVQVAQRDAEIATIRLSTRSLRRNLADVHKCLRVLQIYGMNVKIAAFGAADFVDFADRMHEKLAVGLDETKGLEATLRTLEASVAEVGQVDARLAGECKRVVPMVPDSLARDAVALQDHQARLADLARATEATARMIQAELATALGAIQVGDRARQRLEHVVTGVALLEGALAGRDDAAAQATRAHITGLLGALATAAGVEFESELSALIAAIRGLEQGARTLIALRGADGGDDGEFLRRLEQGIAEAGAMIAQLDRAEAQASRTLGIIQRTVGEVSSRAGAVRDLRFEVRLMAINIALRCRRVEAIGRPVTVIANEIRTHSDQLDGVIDRLVGDEKGLAESSVRMGDQSAEGPIATGEALAGSLATIRAGAAETEQALGTVELRSGEVTELLGRVIGQLDACLDFAPAIATCGVELSAAGEERNEPATCDDGARALLDAIAATYSMADERHIHNAFLLPGMPPLGAELSPPAEVDDDSLFDDALF